jgi:predicted MFS family arabinose efflux permease
MGAFAEGVMGFRALLWLNVAVFVLLAVLVIVFVPKALGETGAAHESTKDIIVGMFKLLGNPGTWICILLIACGYTLWNTCNGYMGTYCTRILELDPSISSSLAIVRSYLIVFIAGVSGGIVMDRFKTKGQGFIFAYAFNAIVAALVFVTSGFQIVCVIVTLVVAYAVNILKSTYWSILGDAGFTLEQTGTATAIISLIGLTPDIFTPAILGQVIDAYEKAGNVETGFNIMLFWMVAWSVLGIFAGFLLKKRKQKLDRIAAAEASTAAASTNAWETAQEIDNERIENSATTDTVTPIE